MSRRGVDVLLLREQMSDRLPGPFAFQYGIINKVCGLIGGWVGRPTSIGTQVTAIGRHRAQGKHDCTTQACVITEHHTSLRYYRAPPDEDMPAHFFCVRLFGSGTACRQYLSECHMARMMLAASGLSHAAGTCWPAS